MKHTLVAWMRDKPGVLNRVASLFRRRSFNIDSLNVGATHEPGVSRMTIVCDADTDKARRIEANLYKMVNVLWVDETVTAHARVRDEVAEGTRTRVHCDVWVEKDDGSRVLIGDASAVR